MNTLAVELVEPRATEVLVTSDSLSVDLADGRTIIVPLAWYPRLWHGTQNERSNFDLIGDGTIIHWPDLDEDLSVSGILAGRHSGESPESLKQWIESRRPSSQNRVFASRVVDIEGIGPAYAEKLGKAGVQTVEALLEQGSGPAGRKRLMEMTGISDRLIMKWVNHADLRRIKGIASQYAELLERAGVDTVLELSKSKAENLHQKMTEINRQFELVDEIPDPVVVAKWVEESKTLPRKVTY